MLVVADSSPLNLLVRVECVGVLPALFGSVLIPPQVAAELSSPRTPEVVRALIASRPAWLGVAAVVTIERIPALDPGEEAAISLAKEAKADALLIDDRDGRRAAAQRGIVVIGTLGVLERAAERGLVQLGGRGGATAADWLSHRSAAGGRCDRARHATEGSAG